MVISSILISYEILGDTAKDDKLMYILNDHKQNYHFCRSKILVEKFGINQLNSIKVTKDFEQLHRVI